MLILYHAWASTCSQKVRLCLAEKGIDYEGRLLNLRRFEQTSPEFLKLNPNGVVPVLIDGDFVMTESTAITDYLDERYPAPALKPSGARGRAEIGMWNRFIDEVPTIAVKLPSFQKNMRPALAQYSPAELEAAIARIPNPDTAARWRAAAAGGIPQPELDRAHADLRNMLDRMEAALAPRSAESPAARGGPWLLGAQFTLADINIAPFVDRIAGFDEYAGFAKWPSVGEWHARLRARPTFAVARFVEQKPTLDQARA